MTCSRSLLLCIAKLRETEQLPPMQADQQILKYLHLNIRGQWRRASLLPLPLLEEPLHLITCPTSLNESQRNERMWCVGLSFFNLQVRQTRQKETSRNAPFKKQRTRSDPHRSNNIIIIPNYDDLDDSGGVEQDACVGDSGGVERDACTLHSTWMFI